MLLFQNGELLPQSEIFQEQITARTNRPYERGKQERQRTEHRSFISDDFVYVLFALR